jgi:hypothetical protein
MPGLLPENKRGKSYDYRTYSGIIYGRPKIGKSTFCAGLDGGKVLFLDTEDGTKHLDVFQVQIEGWTHALEVARELLTEKHEFTLVVVDTISALREMAIEYQLRKMNVPDVMAGKFASHGRGWHAVSLEMIKLWKMLLAGNFGVYFVDHEKTVEKTADGRIITPEMNYNGQKYISVLPQTGGKAGQTLKGLCDLVLRATIDQTGSRVLQTSNTAEVEAGDRSGVLPAVLPLDPSVFVSYFRDAHKKSSAGN